MWTERDQIQAQQYVRRRVVSALATADANHPVSPSRRIVLATMAGGVVLLLAAAVFGVIGLIKPTVSVAWKQSGQVILEQDTGAHYVFTKGLLHPVINETSALLLAGSDKTVTAPAAALDAAPRGVTLGIPGAPDSLPAASGLLTPSLVTCTSAAAGAHQSGPAATVMITGSGRGTQRLSTMSGLRANEGLLVQPAGDTPYLITGGYRYRLPGESAAVALGYQNMTMQPVAPAWVATLPAGRDLRLVAVDGAGNPGPQVGGSATRVGQVLSTTAAVGGATEYYLVLASGLEQITQTEAALVIADTANAAAYPDGAARLIPTSVAAVAAAPQHPAGSDAEGYPAKVPSLADSGASPPVVCAKGNGQTVPVITVGQALPVPKGGRTITTAAGTGSAGGTGGAGAPAGAAASVYVPPGSAALVVARTPGAKAGTAYLVTDEGLKFPVAAAARKALGYGKVKPTPVAPQLLSLLPTGPALTAAAAGKPVPAGSNG